MHFTLTCFLGGDILALILRYISLNSTVNLIRTSKSSQQAIDSNTSFWLWFLHNHLKCQTCFFQRKSSYSNLKFVLSRMDDYFYWKRVCRDVLYSQKIKRQWRVVFASDLFVHNYSGYSFKNINNHMICTRKNDEYLDEMKLCDNYSNDFSDLLDSFVRLNGPSLLRAIRDPICLHTTATVNEVPVAFRIRPWRPLRPFQVYHDVMDKIETHRKSSWLPRWAQNFVFPSNGVDKEMFELLDNLRMVVRDDGSNSTPQPPLDFFSDTKTMWYHTKIIQRSIAPTFRSLRTQQGSERDVILAMSFIQGSSVAVRVIEREMNI